MAFAFGCDFVALDGRIGIREAVLNNWLMDRENLRLAKAAATASTTSVVGAYTLRADLITRITKAAFNHRGAPGTFIGVLPEHPSTRSASTRSDTDSHRGAPGTPIHINIGTVFTHTDTDNSNIANRAVTTRPLF